MALGVVGQKRGMTRIFSEEAASVPVTVIEVGSNRVTQIKTDEVDGYRAVQVTTGIQHRNRISKSLAGIFAKVGTQAGRGLWEFRLDDGEGESLATGSEIRVDLFREGQRVDVAGTTIGKGYAGTIKRHNFSSSDASHGNSLAHRVPGSIGQCQTPGRVFKGKRMPGHMGNVRRAARNLEVVRVDTERNLLFVKGAVPGAARGDVLVRPARRGKE
jgi:large subunit ribosomal protein L3